MFQNTRAQGTPVQGVKFFPGDKIINVASLIQYLVVMAPDKVKIEATNEPAYLYTPLDVPPYIWWVRPATEMEDGRFVRV